MHSDATELKMIPGAMDADAWFKRNIVHTILFIFLCVMLNGSWASGEVGNVLVFVARM